MRYILIIIALTAGNVGANEIDKIYWSTNQCDGYIYHFTPKANQYKIYSKVKIEESNMTTYNTYQITEGKMKLIDKSLYNLVSNNVYDIHTVDFHDIERPVLSSKYSSTPLGMCEKDKSLKIIKEAIEHVKKCPNNILNCTSL